jgi:TetR/AcrR family transcriptional regulator, transcriptional repressor for nem operon
MNDTREHILNVAFNLFLQKSFKEVTLKDIVEKTEMSKGAFYHYFSSKEQLFLELVNNVFSSVLDIPYERFSKESLYNFYIDYINYYVENLKQQNKSGDGCTPNFNYISLIFDAIKLFPDFQEKLLLSKQVQLEAWREIIHAARGRGEIKSPMSDEQIANIFISSSGGIEINNVYEGGSEDIGKNLLNLWDSFYTAIKSI